MKCLRNKWKFNAFPFHSGHAMNSLYLVQWLNHCKYKGTIYQPTIFFLKCYASSQESDSCNLIVRFCVYCIIILFFFYCTSVFLLFRYFPLIVDVFTSVLICNPDLFSLNRCMSFEQQYTTVAFIYFLFERTQI